MSGEFKKVALGSAGPLDWLISGRGAVDPNTACARAASCVACPKNGDAPLTHFFTEPAADFIKAQIEKRRDYHLLTPYDAALGVCTACYCVLSLKVHEPIDLVLKHLKPEVRQDLWERCWILKEDTKPTEDQTTHEHESDSRLPFRRLRRALFPRGIKALFGNRRR